MLEKKQQMNNVKEMQHLKPCNIFKHLCLSIAPFCYMSMYPVIPHKYKEFKQNPINLWEIYKMYAQIR